jgi:hypothetical protein
MNAMIPAASDGTLTLAHRRELCAAIDQLERQHFAARLADYAGQPLNKLIDILPGRLNRRLRSGVQAAIFKCLAIAIDSLEDDVPERSEWLNNLVVGVTGGVGGFFGMAALPIELPLTTALMLRAIAEIARAEGEDLNRLETRLACIEVFALGARGPHDKANLGYYATRVVLARLVSDVAAVVSQRGAISASTPVVARLVGEIAGRFGLVVSDMSGSTVVPVIGAVAGATVNMIFTDHFQRVARGHFTVRRLERIYGADTIRKVYDRRHRLLVADARTSSA